MFPPKLSDYSGGLGVFRFVLKNKGTHLRRKVDEKSCVTPAGTSNKFDVQNKWEENTHTHTPLLAANVCLLL